MSIPTAVSPSEASPVTSEVRPLLQALPVPTRSRKTPPSAEERASEAAAEARKAERELAATLGVSDEASWAYADLNHALLLAHELGREVPCQGRGGEAWTSDDYDDQQVAADRCLDCPAMALCERYRALAKPAAGTWAGVTSDPAKKPRPPKRPRTSRRGVAPRLLSDSPKAVRERERRAEQRARDLQRTPNSRECACGCGGMTRGGRYSPGHDSRHLTRLVREVRAGAMTTDRALRSLVDSPALQAKLTRFLSGR